MNAHVKPFVLRAITGFHLTFCRRELPDNLAIYFHELEEWQRPALADMLSWLADSGYRSVDAGEFVTAGRAGEKRVFLSFDDNFRGWHAALDLFDRHGATCTFYVNTAPIRDVADASAIRAFFDRIRYSGDDTTLSRREIREIHDAGHTIGCHTHSHPVLAQLPRERWDEEIRAPRDYLAALIDAPVEDFSFPFGMRRHFGAELRDYCAGLGFRTIASGISGLQHVAPPDPLNLHRTGWRLDLPLEDNLARVSIHAPIYGGLMGRSAVGCSNWAALPLPFIW